MFVKKKEDDSMFEDSSELVMDKNQGRKSGGSFFVGLLVGVILTVVLCVAVPFVLSKQKPSTTPESEVTMENTELIWSKMTYLKNIMEHYYLWDVDQGDMVEGIYKGMFESLGDPYSVYYTKEEFDALMEDTSGVYYGIGVQVSQNMDTNIITVTRVFKGSPAEEAGVLVEDVITNVNGTDVADMALEDVVGLIKGEPGTSIPITFLRKGEFVTLEVTREKLEVPTVEVEVVDGEIGYVMITSFDRVTANQFRSAMNDLKNQGINKIVFDLRYNGGGYLDIVLDMLDYLLPEGLLVYTEDKAGNREEHFSTAKEAWENGEFIVLTNQYTASASEIFSGALRDYGVAKLVGTNTFGKGIVQDVLPLSDGSGLKITVSEYYTPSGFALHKVGLAPDVEVELNEDAVLYDFETDNQLQEAIRLLQE